MRARINGINQTSPYVTGRGQPEHPKEDVSDHYTPVGFNSVDVDFPTTRSVSEPLHLGGRRNYYIESIHGSRVAHAFLPGQRIFHTPHEDYPHIFRRSVVSMVSRDQLLAYGCVHSIRHIDYCACPDRAKKQNMVRNQRASNTLGVGSFRRIGICTLVGRTTPIFAFVVEKE